jgi:hypothetical protein
MAYGSGFNIADFKSIIESKGPLRSNLYLVSFQQSTTFQNSLLFFTDSVNIPSVDMDSQQIRRYGYGPIESVPFRPVFTPLTMSFIVEATQQNVLNSIINSMSFISPFNGYSNMYTGNISIFNGGGDTGPGYPYEVAFKGDYEFNLSVYVYNEKSDTIMTYTFNQCYVKSVGGISLGWGNNDSYMKADVTFQYTDFSLNRVYSTSIGNAGNLSQIKSIIGKSGLTQTYSPDQVPQSVADAINVNNAQILQNAPDYNNSVLNKDASQNSIATTRSELP